MSKEKNLTFMNKGVPVVEGAKHRKLAHFDPLLKGDNCVNCLRSMSLGVMKGQRELDSVIVGPAIDRLYEFEKIGLEPEEIELTMAQHDFTIFNRNIELQLENANLKNKNQSLQNNLKVARNELRNFKSAIYGLSPANVDRLQKENEMLKEEIEALNKQFGTIVSLRAENERLWGKIQDLNEETENLTGENEELNKRLNMYRSHIKMLEAMLRGFGVEVL